MAPTKDVYRGPTRIEILCQQERPKMEVAVNNFLDLGWTLHGDMHILVANNGVFYHQCMIHYDSSPVYPEGYYDERKGPTQEEFKSKLDSELPETGDRYEVG